MSVVRGVIERLAAFIHGASLSAQLRVLGLDIGFTGFPVF
jgi:hypothetical protein